MTHPAKHHLTHINERHRAISALIVITALWGFTYPLMQNATANFPASWFLVLRFGAAVAALLLFSWRSLRSRQLWSRHNRRWLFLAAATGLANFGGFAGQTIGLQTTTPGKAAFITGLSVVIVPLILVLLKKTTSRGSMSAALLSVIGLACLMGQGLSFDFVVGDAWVLLGALAFAFEIILMGMLPKDADVLLLTTIQVAVCLLCAFVWAAGEHPQWPTLPIEILAGILGTAIYLGVVTTAFALTVQTWAQRCISPSHAALIFSAEPAWGAVASRLISMEQFTGLGLLGCTLMLIGMVWPQLFTLLNPRHN